jgi:hypothetical protein
MCFQKLPTLLAQKDLWSYKWQCVEYLIITSPKRKFTLHLPFYFLYFKTQKSFWRHCLCSGTSLLVHFLTWWPLLLSALVSLHVFVFHFWVTCWGPVSLHVLHSLPSDLTPCLRFVYWFRLFLWTSESHINIHLSNIASWRSVSIHNSTFLLQSWFPTAFQDFVPLVFLWFLSPKNM